MKFLLCFLFFFLSCFVSKISPTVKLIIDTDMDFDVDDVGAVCAAHAMADKGWVDILAIVHDAGYPRGIGAVSVLNHYYGRDDVHLGAFKGNFGAEVPGVYVDDLVDNWDSPISHYDEVKDAVEIYRQVLDSAEDNSVVISSVGFLTNIADLLDSPADEVSEKTGYELVRDKVKLLAIMGGFHPSGSEFNLNCGFGLMGDPLECYGQSQKAVQNMPPEVKIMFSGFEVGVSVQSGGALTSCAPETNPCRQAYIDYVGEGNNRNSWDPLTTVYAVRGAEFVSCEEAGEGERNEVNEDGSNYWVDEDNPNHSYLILKDAEAAGNTIDELLCTPPKSGGLL